MKIRKKIFKLEIYKYFINYKFYFFIIILLSSIFIYNKYLLVKYIFLLININYNKIFIKI